MQKISGKFIRNVATVIHVIRDFSQIAFAKLSKLSDPKLIEAVWVILDALSRQPIHEGELAGTGNRGV